MVVLDRGRGRGNSEGKGKGEVEQSEDDAHRLGEGWPLGGTMSTSPAAGSAFALAAAAA